MKLNLNFVQKKCAPERPLSKSPAKIELFLISPPARKKETFQAPCALPLLKSKTAYYGVFPSGHRTEMEIHLGTKTNVPH
jgi:hypothetical protein